MQVCKTTFFVIQFQGLIIPIEVKSGKTGHLRSLHQFMNIAPHKLAVKISSSYLQVEDAVTPEGKPFRLIHIPFYYISEVEKILSLYS